MAARRRGGRCPGGGGGDGGGGEEGGVQRGDAADGAPGGFPDALPGERVGHERLQIGWRREVRGRRGRREPRGEHGAVETPCRGAAAWGGLVGEPMRRPATDRRCALREPPALAGGANPVPPGC